MINADEFKSKLLASIGDNHTVALIDNWSLFAYLGETECHIHLFKDGIEECRISRNDVERLREDALRWLARESLTMLPPCPASSSEA